MSDFTDAPHVSDTLLAYLEEKFPDRLPRRSTSAEGMHELIGQQKLLDHLRTVNKAQREAQLTSHV